MQLSDQKELRKFVVENIGFEIKKETPITNEQAALMTAYHSKFFIEIELWKHWISFRRRGDGEGWDINTLNHNRLMYALMEGMEALHKYQVELKIRDQDEMLDPGYIAEVLRYAKEAFDAYCDMIKDWSDANIIEIVSFIVSGASEDCCNFIKRELLKL